MIECVGWWQQRGLGRQPMLDLILDFQGPTFNGHGRDVVANFTMSGSVRQDGSVEILKRYRHRHSVLYVGHYDGEGTLNGRWDIEGHQGEWSIRLLKSSGSQKDDIQDFPHDFK